MPVEFVDAIEFRKITEKIETIKQRTAGLNLKSYQIYALVSRAYNCGNNGALDGYGDMSFIESYIKYFNPKTDNIYGKTKGDFNHKLYTEFMRTPIKSAGQVLEGLVKRRESEWTLFQTGYMDRLNKFVD